MADIDRRLLYKQFQEAFPIESLKDMTLEKYTNLNRDDSFCYWLESRTYALGSFWGGSSFKFGIYKYANPPKTPDRYAVFDENYAWYNKYNKKTPQEAFEVIKAAIVSIAELARNGKLEAIDKINVLGEAYKWKIAFLYSNESLIPIYKRDMLNIVSAELGLDEPKKKSIPYIQRFLMQIKGDNDLYDFYDELLSILNSKNAHNTFAALKKAVKEKLKSDLKFNVNRNAANFIWIGTKDGIIKDSECHYEFCSDNKKTANQIIDLNLQLMAISNTKGFLFECKNNIQSADTMMSKVNENNIQYDYGSTFHPMIEKLTEKAGNKVCGFDETNY